MGTDEFILQCFDFVEEHDGEVCFTGPVLFFWNN